MNRGILVYLRILARLGWGVRSNHLLRYEVRIALNNRNDELRQLLLLQNTYRGSALSYHSGYTTHLHTTQGPSNQHRRTTPYSQTWNYPQAPNSQSTTLHHHGNHQTSSGDCTCSRSPSTTAGSWSTCSKGWRGACQRTATPPNHYRAVRVWHRWCSMCRSSPLPISLYRFGF